MHPADIKAAIEKAGSSQADIARKLGITRCAVSLVVSGHSKSANVAGAIAEVTGIPAHKLWPGLYEKEAA